MRGRGRACRVAGPVPECSPDIFFEDSRHLDIPETLTEIEAVRIGARAPRGDPQHSDALSTAPRLGFIAEAFADPQSAQAILNDESADQRIGLSLQVEAQRNVDPADDLRSATGYEDHLVRLAGAEARNASFNLASSGWIAQLSAQLRNSRCVLKEDAPNRQ